MWSMYLPFCNTKCIINRKLVYRTKSAQISTICLNKIAYQFNVIKIQIQTFKCLVLYVLHDNCINAVIEEKRKKTTNNNNKPKKKRRDGNTYQYFSSIFSSNCLFEQVHTQVSSGLWSGTHQNHIYIFSFVLFTLFTWKLGACTETSSWYDKSVECVCRQTHWFQQLKNVILKIAVFSGWTILMFSLKRKKKKQIHSNCVRFCLDLCVFGDNDNGDGSGGGNTDNAIKNSVSLCC